MSNLNITINNQPFVATLGQTILDVALANNIEIPTLCFHPDLKIKANCRICVVEIKGRQGLFTACSTLVEDGMEILTESPAITSAREANLELLFAQHQEECGDCVINHNCTLLKLAKKYQIKIDRYTDRKSNFQTYKFGPSIEFNSSKCIDCGNCVEACHNQAVNFLEVKKSVENLPEVTPSQDPKKDCIYCGQCVAHCPVGAFEAVGEFEEVFDAIKDPEKKVVVQFAPAVRTAIGEEFDLSYSPDLEGKMIAGLRKLGVNYVFDVSVGADFTTFEESDECVECVKAGGEELPILTSCCPAWVKYVEFNYPQLTKHLAKSRSPQIILGGLIKKYWAPRQNLNPSEIKVISIMPCTSKKYEIRRPELEIDGLKAVDNVLTTRELAYLFRRQGINLAELEPEKCDNPFANYSGAGIIYGASGGVMESAVRTAYLKMTGNELPEIDFKAVRGEQGIKKAEVILPDDKKIKIVVVSGNGNAKKILDELVKDPHAYDYIEVMACPGGCIGGGGQPLPADAKIRQKRAQMLYQIDRDSQNRLAHHNPVIKDLYQTFLKDENLRKKLMRTEFGRK